MMNRTIASALALVISLAMSLGVVAGCGSSAYQLPKPPPADEQRDVAADPAAQAEQRRARYLEARAALLKLYSALTKERFEEAEQLLSQQTRDFLAYGNETGDPSTALSSGQLVLPDGRKVTFDPVQLLLGGKIQKIADTLEGVEEHETRRRRELFVFDPEGEPHKVVMIVEGGQWVLHRTSIDPSQK